MAMDVGAATFERDVVARSREVPVIVDFWAPWCGPCRTLGPTLERLAAQSGGKWILVKVNTDENQALAQRYRISGIPAVKAFVDGAVVDEFVGAQPEPQVRAFLDRVVPDEGARLAKAAREAEERGDTGAATRLYAQVRAQDPRQPDALLFEARRLAATDKAQARELLRQLDGATRTQKAQQVAQLQLALDAQPLDVARAAFRADPDAPAARFGVGLALAADGQWEDALEAFLSLVRQDRAWGDDAARKAMLLVFDAVGQRSAIADKWRRKLSMELYK